MKRIDIFEKLKCQQEQAFSRLSLQERRVIRQYQQKRKNIKYQQLIVQNIKKQPNQRPLVIQISSPETRNHISNQNEQTYHSCERIYNKISQNHQNIQLKHCPSSKQRLSSENIYCRPSKRETRVSILHNPNIPNHQARHNETKPINFQRNRSYDLNADIQIYNRDNSYSRQNESFERKSAHPERILHPQVMDTAENNYYLFRRQKAERNRILHPHPQASVSFSSYQARPESSGYQVRRSQEQILRERVNTIQQEPRISSLKPENSEREKRSENSSKPPFVVSRKVSDKKRVKIRESAFSKAKQYGKKINISLSNNSINSSVEKRSTAANSSCNRHENSNSSIKQSNCLRIQTVPQSRTNNYFQSKRDFISNRFLEEQRQIRAARKNGLINTVARPQYLEGAKYTRPSSQVGSRNNSVHNSIKQSRGISHQNEYSNCSRKAQHQNESFRHKEKSLQNKYGSPLRNKNQAVSHFNPAPLSQLNKREQNSSHIYNSNIGSRASYIRSQSTNPSNKQAKIVGRKISNNNMNNDIVSQSLAKRYNLTNSHFSNQEPINAHSYMRPTSSSQACQSENITNQISLKSQARSNIAKRIGDTKPKVRGSEIENRQTNYSAIQNQKEYRKSIITSQQSNNNGQKQKLKKTKSELYNIINRLSSHLKICNNFAKELEKIEF